MTTQEKKDKIKALAIQMLEDSHAAMLKNIDKAINSGSINIDDWDGESAPMILPKAIVTAILKSESTQFSPGGTIFKKQFDRDVRNLGYFI